MLTEKRTNRETDIRPENIMPLQSSGGGSIKSNNIINTRTMLLALSSWQSLQ